MAIFSDNLSTITEVEPRLVSGQSASGAEESVERALRPKRLADYTGQTRAREQLEIFIEATKRRGEALDHVLLFGPPV